MAQEYFINSQTLEDTIRQLLPSQGGAGAGFDLSASTQIIPIIDVTPSAEGSLLRQDLQTSISHDNNTSFNVNNATPTLINNTGYWRITGTISGITRSSGVELCEIQINDGSTTKVFYCTQFKASTGASAYAIPIDLTFFLGAGDSLIGRCTLDTFFCGSFRQIATINGELVNPT